MADNYLQFSEFLPINEKTREEITKVCKDIVFKMLEENWFDFIISQEDREMNDRDQLFWYLMDTCCVEVDSIDDNDDKLGIWFRSEKYGNIELAQHFAEQIITEFSITEPFILTWACSCSKLRFGEFSGGGFRIRLGQETLWLNDIAEYLSTHP